MLRFQQSKMMLGEDITTLMIPGLMIGGCGVAYMIMRLENPDLLPSVLVF